MGGNKGKFFTILDFIPQTRGLANYIMLKVMASRVCVKPNYKFSETILQITYSLRQKRT